MGEINEVENLVESIKKKPQLVIVVVVLILAGIAGSIVFLNSRQDGDDYEFSQDFGSDSAGVESTRENKENSNDSCATHIDIAGAVEGPGVYCLEEGAILQKLIEEAGGFRDDVCQIWLNKSLNLAAKATDGQKIYVPFEDDPECGAEVAGDSSGDSAQSESRSQVPEGGYCTDGKININSASSEVLQKLSGVGPSTAQKIIDGRPYSRLEDLLDVKGIGDATFDKLKDDICL